MTLVRRVHWRYGRIYGRRYSRSRNQLCFWLVRWRRCMSWAWPGAQTRHRVRGKRSRLRNRRGPAGGLCGSFVPIPGFGLRFFALPLALKQRLGRGCWYSCWSWRSRVSWCDSFRAVVGVRKTSQGIATVIRAGLGDIGIAVPLPLPLLSGAFGWLCRRWNRRRRGWKRQRLGLMSECLSLHGVCRVGHRQGTSRFSLLWCRRSLAVLPLPLLLWPSAFCSPSLSLGRRRRY